MTSRMLFRPAFAILVISAATIVGAWGVQLAGYAPCELCLAQRWPYYVGVPLAAVVTFAAANCSPKRLLLAGFVLLALVFGGSAVFGGYHAGVEWGFWPGPTACTGSQPQPQTMEEFRRVLNTVRVVRCDAVALRVFGLSLAVWNALVSIVLFSLACRSVVGCLGSGRRQAVPRRA